MVLKIVQHVLIFTVIQTIVHVHIIMYFCKLSSDYIPLTITYCTIYNKLFLGHKNVMQQAGILSFFARFDSFLKGENDNMITVILFY